MYLLHRAHSLVQRYWNRLLLLFGSRGAIVVFHEVAEQNTNNTEASCFSTTEEFADFLSYNRGSFCPLDELLSGTSNGIVVTFDDVPESVYQNAIPLLKEQKVPFVLYFSPKFIGKPGFMSEDQIREVSQCPLCTIGAHTMNHTKLRLEKDSYSDIAHSKLAMERIIGKPVEHLAYPYGRADSVSCKVRKEARLAGFKSAVCTIPTNVPKWFDRWYVPRVTVRRECRFERLVFDD